MLDQYRVYLATSAVEEIRTMLINVNFCSKIIKDNKITLHSNRPSPTDI